MPSSTGLAVFEDEKVLNPLDEVVLEPTFYNLMEEVRCDEFVNFRAREPVREWLKEWC
jgi:hypothetical protein